VQASKTRSTVRVLVFGCALLRVAEAEHRPALFPRHGPCLLRPAALLLRKDLRLGIRKKPQPLSRDPLEVIAPKVILGDGRWHQLGIPLR
jgi:hypothetical protein